MAAAMITGYIENRGFTLPLQIDDKRRLGSGGIGTVFAVYGEFAHDFVAKIYREPRHANRAKIEALIANRPDPLFASDDGRQYPRFAWPTHLITSETGMALGYLMPKVDPRDSLTLDHFFDRYLMRRLQSNEERSLTFKLNIARNLSFQVAELHARGIYVIDLKPQNITVFQRTHFITLLDCDSFCIRGPKGKYFPGTHYSRDYIAPEALREGTPPQKLREPQDRFALAVILFQLLNNGIHPFQGVVSVAKDLPANDDKVREGLYPHGRTRHFGIAPIAQSIHDCFDDATRAMFDRTFLAARPDERPTAKEWGRHFKELIDQRALQKCGAHPHDPAHIRFAGKPCGVCHFEGVVAGLARQGRSNTPRTAAAAAAKPAATGKTSPVAAAAPARRPAVRRTRLALVAAAILFAALIGAVMNSTHNDASVTGNTDPSGLVDTPPVPNKPPAAPDPRSIENQLGLDAATIKMIQSALAALSFDPGHIDGKLGPNTRAAIRQYQAAHGLPETGFLDGDLVDRIEKDAPGTLEAGEDRWAAVAYDSENTFYYIYDVQNAASAEEQVMQACRKGNAPGSCQRATVFAGGKCYSLARNGGQWGWAVRDLWSDAREAAVTNCGSGCRNTLTFCADGRPGSPDP